MTRPPMTPIEIKWLHTICQSFELDTMEIDSSITYRENKAHLLSLPSARSKEELFLRELDRYEAMSEARPPQGSYHKGALCPKCGSTGSGLHTVWVLNEQKKRYEPYYRFAHSVKIEGHYRVKWHYIRKAQAIEILSNSWVGGQFNVRQSQQI